MARQLHGSPCSPSQPTADSPLPEGASLPREARCVVVGAIHESPAVASRTTSSVFLPTAKKHLSKRERLRRLAATTIPHHLRRSPLYTRGPFVTCGDISSALRRITLREAYGWQQDIRKDSIPTPWGTVFFCALALGRKVCYDKEKSIVEERL